MNAQPLDKVPASTECVSRGLYRRLFHSLINEENFSDLSEQVHAELDQCFAALGQSQSFDVDCLNDPTALSVYFDHNRNDFSTFGVLGTEHRRKVLPQFAPIVLTDGAWLRSSFQAANSHTPVSAELYRFYTALKVSDRARNPISRYQSVMQQYGMRMPAIYTRAFSQQSNILEIAYRAAVVQLGLAYCVKRYPAEIIGYTIARAYDPVLLRILSRLNTNADAYSTDKQSDHGLQDLSLASLEAYIRSHKNGQDPAQQYRRIGLGIGLYQWVYGIFLSDLQYQLGNMPNEADEALAVFRRKAKFAKGYHGSIQIGDRSLDSWFETGLTDGQAFLNGLTASNYVDRENPENSRLIKASISTDGPMFGVFSANDIDTLLAWLRKGSNTPSQQGGAGYDEPDLTKSTQPAGNRLMSKTKVSTRELYYRLINRGLQQETLPNARRYVDRCLRMTRLQTKWLRNHQCFPYDNQRFNRYVEDLYRREMAAYKPVVGHPKFGREVYRWGIEQFAPTLLVDGCWLQNIERLCDCNPEVGERLGAIYADEIGSGRCADNHANVYRCLLDDLKIRLPDFDTPEFADHPGFLDSAFDLPAYFLAISQFPQSYLPEILGLNMAIELSGLGAGYMRLAESLEFWGIDAKIVRLHLSIDNLASGHSEIAKQAIGIYLDQVLANGGEAEMQRHWRRIWVGYVSLTTVPRIFKWALVFSYFKKFRRFGF